MITSIARDSKGRLKSSDETISIKVSLDKTTAEQLREVAEVLEVPMASVIRQGISKMYEDLNETNKNEK